MRVTLVVLASLAAASPAAATASPTSVTVYLERNGKTVTTRGGDDVAIPRFGGGDRAWTQLVACVKDRFAPFQVTITDRKPGRGDHITALIGGRASMLGLSDRTTNGIGPYSGDVIPNATVHVFSRVGTGERDVDNLCAVTAHEVGHALGLDHSNLCGDIMSYHNDECGTQRFLDAAAACGESEDRDCANGDATQNSYRRLASLVGLRPGAPRTGPKPPGAAADTDDSLDQGDSGDGSDAIDAGDAWDWSDDDTSPFDGFAPDDETTTPPQTTAPQPNPPPTSAPQTPDPWAGDADLDDGVAPSDDDGAAFSDDDDTDRAEPSESDEADEQPEERAPRWNPRRGGWRDIRREGRRNRWRTEETNRPHCGQ